MVNSLGSSSASSGGIANLPTNSHASGGSGSSGNVPTTQRQTSGSPVAAGVEQQRVLGLSPPSQQEGEEGGGRGGELRGVRFNVDVDEGESKEYSPSHASCSPPVFAAAQEEEEEEGEVDSSPKKEGVRATLGKAVSFIEEEGKQAEGGEEEAAPTPPRWESTADNNLQGEGEEDEHSDYDEEEERGGEELVAELRCQWWNWTEKKDELTTVMQGGEALHGFVEEALTFPPSFRWRPGARADYSKQGAEIFGGCYTLRKESEGTGMKEGGARPPSYTDRILCHSLPDLMDDLIIEDYDMAEHITASDHRPVAAALRLTVTSADEEQDVGGSNSSNSSTMKPTIVEITLSDLRYVPKAAGEAGLNWGGKLAAMYLERSVGSLVVHWPLACEDPMNMERRIQLVEQGLITTEAALLANGDEEEEEERRRSSTQHQHHLENIHELPIHPQHQHQQSYRVRSSVSLTTCPMHAVIRLRDRAGKDLGQGVLCLNGVAQQQRELSTSASQADGGRGNGVEESKEAVVEKGGKEGRGGEGMTMRLDVTDGGKLVGLLELKVCVFFSKPKVTVNKNEEVRQTAAAEGRDKGVVEMISK